MRKTKRRDLTCDRWKFSTLLNALSVETEVSFETGLSFKTTELCFKTVRISSGIIGVSLVWVSWVSIAGVSFTTGVSFNTGTSKAGSWFKAPLIGCNTGECGGLIRTTLNLLSSIYLPVSLENCKMKTSEIHKREEKGKRNDLKQWSMHLRKQVQCPHLYYRMGQQCTERGTYLSTAYQVELSAALA